MPSNKLRVLIADLTDCEGCELQFINLRDELLQILEHVEIVNWRLAGINERTKQVDVAFVEGTPLSHNELEELIQIRRVSKKVVALGACAALGGVQASLSNRQREIAEKRTPYQNELAPRPLSHFVKVDHTLNGCPVRTKDLSRLISEVFHGKLPIRRSFPVCLECRSALNECVLLNGQPCLGPLTEGSCEAICVTQGQHCYGCNGPLEGANFEAFYSLMRTHGYKRPQIELWIDLFMASARRQGNGQTLEAPGRTGPDDQVKG